MVEPNIGRKLSPSELVYDFEHSRNCHIFSNALLFSARPDFFSNKSKINQAVLDWSRLHAFLRAKIVPDASEQHGFSLNRNFLLVPSSKLDVMRNVELLSSTDWRSIYERELNRQAPINYDRLDLSQLLWRIVLIEPPPRTGNKFCMILTIHHAITDGRNAFSIMLQLLRLLDGTEMLQVDEDRDEIPAPLESFLPNFTRPAARQLLDFDDSECKIPTSFRPVVSVSASTTTRFDCFTVDEAKTRKLLGKCKSHELKFTGCLELICIMANDQVYAKFASPSESYGYHLMVSLRPFLGKPNTCMGFIASHLDCSFRLPSNFEAENFSEIEFWRLAKIKSEQLHERLRDHEHWEMAKQDAVLVHELETKEFVNGGGVHFALSNLGALSSNELQDGALKLEEFYYQVSLDAHRWSSLVFHGVSSLDGRLVWGISYNGEFVRPEIVEFMIFCVRSLIDKLTQ